MERVTLRKQTSWPEYLAESLTRQVHIMLVPLVPFPIERLPFYGQADRRRASRSSGVIFDFGSSWRVRRSR